MERHLGDIWAGVIADADTGNPDSGSNRNLSDIMELVVRAAEKGREELAIGGKHKLILCSLPDLRHHLAFNGNKIEVVAKRSEAVWTEHVPGHRQRSYGRLRESILNLAMHQVEKTVMDIGKARRVGHIADPQGDLGLSCDPNAPDAVLQHHG